MKKSTEIFDVAKLTYAALTKSNFNDLEQLFGDKGACGGCWCMTWRLSTSAYKENKGENNRRLLYNLVNANEPLGVIAYYNDLPIGWCSVSPKSRLFELKKSRILLTSPFAHTWSIVCLFILPEFRRKYFSTNLIRQASDYAFRQGALIVEAYPVVPKNDHLPDVFAWTGIYKSFHNAGFITVKQNSPGKMVMSIQKAEFENAK